MQCVSVHQGIDHGHGDMVPSSEICHGMSSLNVGSKYKPKSQPPAKFSNPSTITSPETLKDLITQLHDIFDNDDISVEYVQTLMASYASKSREWKRFAKFDPHRYTRNLVDAGNGKFNLMILCWNEGQGSSIHSHANSHCFLKVLDGKVREELFDWPHPTSNENNDADNSSPETHESGMRKLAENVYSKNECTYINDDIGLHRVENPSHADKSVTLHLYSPPFDECQCFDERTGRAVTAKVTFWSKFGKRTPFGKCPDSAPSSCKEANK